MAQVDSGLVALVVGLSLRVLRALRMSMQVAPSPIRSLA